MATRGFLPLTDSGLLAWSQNFSDLITATPTAFGLVAGDATAYAALHAAFADAMAANAAGVRSKATVATKNTARDNLKASARLLAKRVEGTATVADAQKYELGLTVRSAPQPIPAPAFAPALDVVSVVGRTVKVRLHDPNNAGRRGLPEGVDGAAVFSYTGATAPADPGEYKFEGNTSRNVFDVNFPTTLAPGAQVWLTAMFFNERKQSGPACAPVGVQFGGVTLAA